VDLRVAGVAEAGALLVGAPDGGRVRSLGVRRQVKDVGVTARGQHDGVGDVNAQLAGHHVAGDNAARRSVNDNDVQHVMAVEHFHRAGVDLAFERLVAAEQKLLARLPARIERPRDLSAAETPVGQHAAVLAGKRHARGHALVDDIDRHLRQPVDIGLAGAEIAALDGVIEQAKDRVAVILVVFRGIDAALCGDRVRPARRILETKRFHPVAEFSQRRRGGAAGETGADDDHRVLALVGGIDQLHFEPGLVPFLFKRA